MAKSKCFKYQHSTYDYATMSKSGRLIACGEVEAQSIADAQRQIDKIIGSDKWQTHWNRINKGHYRKYNGDARTSVPYWNKPQATEKIELVLKGD